jgi:trehalose 6-phosphate synthase/phosphatase
VAAGANQAAVVQRLLSHEPPFALITAVADDRTDEELFAGLPPTAIPLHVGPGVRLATQRLRDPFVARVLLTTLLNESRDSPIFRPPEAGDQSDEPAQMP